MEDLKKNMEELQKSLEAAILIGNIEEVEKIIYSSKHSDQETKQKTTDLLSKGLYNAVAHDRFEIAKLLLSNGADVNYQDVLNQSVLLCAIQNKSTNLDLVQFLLQSGADINHENVNGQSDFLHILSNGNLPYADILDMIDSVSDLNERDIRTGGCFLHLVSKCHEDDKKILVIEKLLRKGLSINSTDNNDDTPLHIMATVADVRSLELCLDNGADITARNRLGETLLHSIASSNEFDDFQETLKLLLVRGLDINEKDSEGRSAVHHAMMSKDTSKEAIKELLEHDISLNIKDVRGRNEIFYAVDEVTIEYSQSDLDRRAEVIKFLAETGVDVSQGDSDGITPLHLATMKNDLEILVTLLDCGADVMKKSNTGATALHWACKTYNIAHIVIHYYWKDSQDLNVVDRYGSTALHWAIWFREISVSQTLLQIGCDYSIKDNSGNSPSDLAKKLHFEAFLNLIENEQFKDMEFLTLMDPVLKCCSDPILACPLLHYIRKEKGKLDMESYTDHVNLHTKALRSNVEKVITLKEMGLFYEIEANRSIPEKVYQLILLLVEHVSRCNVLFSCEVQAAGSMFEGTKVKLTDEFDYLLNLSVFSEAFFPIESETFPDSFVKLKLKCKTDSPRFSRYLTEDYFLDCKLLVRDLYTLLNNELKLILLEQVEGYNYQNFMCLKFLNEISCSVSSLKFQIFEKEAKFFRISIDLVPTISFDNWMPKKVKVTHPFQCDDIQRPHGFSVVIKTPDRCHVKNFTLFYRISYANMEQSILQSIPFSIKKGYILLKALLETGYVPTVIDHDNNRAVKKYLTSYHLKTCFLHEWQRLKDEVNDTQEQDSPCMEIALSWATRIVDFYEKSMQTKCLATFFDPDKNLFGLEGMSDVMQEPDIFIPLVGLLKHILKIVSEEEIYLRH